MKSKSKYVKVNEKLKWMNSQSEWIPEVNKIIVVNE